MASLEGTTLSNRYFLRRKVGEGGTAEVYEAWDMVGKVKMAVKALHSHKARNSDRIEVFEREARWLRDVGHPYIVRLYEYICQGELVFLVMDWVEGKDLRKVIEERQAPLSLKEVSRIFQPVCIALNYTHQKEIYHCDVKPANILLSIDGKVLLSDFGIARLASEKRGGGTPAYMAPEQILEQTIDGRTDIYSLGVTMYEIFSGGMLPFRGDSHESKSKGDTKRERVEWEHCNLQLPPITQYNPSLSRDLVNIVDRALNKDPFRRFPTTLELWDEFEQACRKTRFTGYEPPESLTTTIVHYGTPPTRPTQPSQPTIKPALLPKCPCLIGISGMWTNQIMPIDQHQWSIGRANNNQLCLQDPSISRKHATILRLKSGVFIRDENSKAGTYVNNQRIGNDAVPLRHGDKLRIGLTWYFEFRMR